MKGSQGKIAALESLRGYLAFWVFGSHLLQLCGGQLASHPYWSVLANAEYAVQVFMILSGFVISYLLSNRKETYRPYLTRRFFRIYPVFLLAACSGFLLHRLWGVMIRDWWPGFFTSGVLADFTTKWQATDQHYFGQALSVLTMTNGMMPHDLLPFAPTAFIGVVWSLSLEMQFYLVAPLLHRLLSRSKMSRLLTLAGVVGLVAVRQVVLGRIGNFTLITYPSFLPFSIEFFVIGMLSQQAYAWMIRDRTALEPAVGATGVSLLGVAIGGFLLVTSDDLRVLAKGHLLEYTGRWTSMLIWMATLAWIVDSILIRRGWLQALGRKLLESPVPLFFGRISYSLYLWHVPVILLVQWWLYRLGAVDGWHDCLAWTSVISLPLVVAVAAASYRWVELPFIRLGTSLLRPAAPTP